MSNPPAVLYFDFVDPLSYLVDIEARALGARVARVGLELVPPPLPMRSTSDAPWAARLAEARALAEAAGVTLAPPALVPWTRKAHEIHRFAAEHGRADEVRAAIFEAYFTRGEDIGRIDRLVTLAAGCGLDPVAARTALGVDRFEEVVLAERAAAEAAGVVDVPALVVAGRILQGFRNRAALFTLVE